MELIHFYGILTLLTAVSSRVIDILPKKPGKQLFLSRHVVTESGEFDGGVLVNEDGIIEAVLKRDITDSLLAQNLHDLKIIDGGELALMAGVVDSHVHVNEPGRTSWEGYVTATQAAAVGGITTIIDMPLNSIPPTTTLENLRIKAAMAKEEVYVDVGFWGGVIPGNEIELHDLIRAGVVGFKCFLTDSGVDEFPNVAPTDLTKVFEVLNGTGTVLAFHAEVSLNTTDNECTTDCPNPALFDTYLDTHPEEMELKAVSLVTSFLPKTDVHVHIVHVSAEGVVPILEAAREERIKSGYKGWKGGITSETCHHYLTLSSEQIPPGHTEYKCSPPIRNNTNKQQLWEYIRNKRLDLVASDHSPSVQQLKGTDFLKAWGGISSVQFGLSLFWTEAKARGYGLNTVSHFLSAGPAQLTGLEDKKGAIRPGLDADLIFFDPNASFVVTPEVIRYKNKISPYMNRVLNGIVQRTYLRGQLIYAYGELIGQPKGQLLLNDDVIETLNQGETDITTTLMPVNNVTIESGIKNETEAEVSTISSPRFGNARALSESIRNETIPTLTDETSFEPNRTSIKVDNKNISKQNNPPVLENPIASDNHTSTTVREQNELPITTELTNVLKTTAHENILHTTSLDRLTSSATNNYVLTTTESPTALGSVKKWVQGLINRGGKLTNSVTLLLTPIFTLAVCIFN